MEEILVPLQRLQNNQPLRTLKFVERYVGDDLTNFQQEGLYKIPKQEIKECTLRHAYYILDQQLFTEQISNHTAHPQIGFQNSGASCYANTALQALISMSRFRSLLRSDYFTKAAKSPLLQAFTTVLQSKQAVILPDLFYSNLKLFNMSPLVQSDATELILRVIDTFHSRETESAGQPQNDQTTAIEQLFGCVVESKIVCKRCSGEKSTQFISRSQLLPIQKSLKRSFQEFLKPVEISGYDCEFCGKNATISKSQRVIQASGCCIFQIQRWDQFGQKINKSIDIPEKLNLSKGIDQQSMKLIEEGGRNYTFAQSVISSMSKKQGDYTHQLKAIICHSGVSVGFGHYYSYIYSNGWQIRDDEIIQKISFDQIQLNEAFMLIYEEIGSKMNVKGVKIHDVDNTQMFQEKSRVKQTEEEVPEEKEVQKANFGSDELMDKKALTSQLLHQRVDEMDAEIDQARRRKTQKTRDANRAQRMGEVQQRRSQKAQKWREGAHKFQRK